jgi:tRNA(Ile)-lysidine synthase
VTVKGHTVETDHIINDMASASRPPNLHALVRRVAHGLRHRCGVGAGEAVVVAVSGGADSVALLRAMHLLAPRRTWGQRLVVAHVQHHLRDDAEDDARFVAQLAATLGLPFARRDVHPLHHGGNVEATARRQRYAALAQIAREHDATFIATAHHADDQLETLLMRLVRGTGVAGLRGIAWKRPAEAKGHEPVVRVIRPMLAATHDQALDFLGQLQQPWRDDRTNRDTTRLRARLRHDVLPHLRHLHPRVAQHALALADDVRALSSPP